MSNKNITRLSRRIAFRAPLDIWEAAIDRALVTGHTVTDVMVDTLREAWSLPDPRDATPPTPDPAP